jgi:nicotinate-nucleotide pyrophosphorylase (carboxylating)
VGERGVGRVPSLDLKAAGQAIRRAVEEDVGSGDLSTLWTIQANATGQARLISKAEGIVAGLDVAAATFNVLDPRICFEKIVEDGASVLPEQVIAEVSGPTKGILTAERMALNFLQRMSGIATGTARFVRAIAGTGARILDTRKTVPGLRLLDKYAVRVGGGQNHRMGLYDMVLLKENHIEAADGIGPAVWAVRVAMERTGPAVKIGVEVETFRELDEAIAVGVDWILLDNMPLDQMRRAVEIVQKRSPVRPMLEASGNVTLDNVRDVAKTGVDLISVGALTHSVTALDISLRFRSR